MQSIEVTGKSVEEATQAASIKLGVPAEQIKVTVLEETKGLFGKSQYRVLAETGSDADAKTAPAAKAVTKSEPAADEPAKDETAASAAEKPAEKPAKKPAKAKAEKASAAADDEAPAEAEAPAKPAKAAKADKASKDEKSAKKSDAAEGSDAKPDEEPATAEDGELLLGLLRELLAKGELDVDLEVRDISGRYVTVSLDGKDVSHLLGRQGETLNALQSLVNIMIGRRYGKHFRATLDSGDFRGRREAKLEKLARDLAAEVVKRQEEAVLDALPAFERRVVHQVLQTIPGVTTYSEGEEPNRHVVIAPKSDED